jgi:hypothetical protein
MIERQDERICLAAIGARSCAEQLDHIFGALGRELLVATSRSLDVSLFVLFVVLALVLGSAVAAVVVLSLRAVLSTPCELCSTF